MKYYMGFMVYRDVEFESEHSKHAYQTNFDVALANALDLVKEYGSMLILSNKEDNK
jgi:uncharacterized protein YutE (UPF0331/DUF86 family)